MAECTIGDLFCGDAETLYVCEDGALHTPYNCEEVCMQSHGSQARSLGCNAEAEDPCLCDSTFIDHACCCCRR